MRIKPIKTESDYQSALKRLAEIFDASANTAEGDEAGVLTILVDHYESVHFPIEDPDPIEAIKIRMEELSMKQKDLIGLIGGKSRVSEVMNKKKRLTVDMIRTLEEALNISASILVKPYSLHK